MFELGPGSYSFSISSTAQRNQRRDFLNFFADENGDGIVNADDRVIIGNTNIRDGKSLS